MELTARGQYSKNSGLAFTVGSSAWLLAYVEPSLLLPYIVSMFDTALDSVSLCMMMSSNFIFKAFVYIND